LEELLRKKESKLYLEIFQPIHITKKKMSRHVVKKRKTSLCMAEQSFDMRLWI
jgi:hypothetical protein